MGLVFRKFLDGNPRVFACQHCGSHLTTYDCLVSKAFQGHFGRAWLFKNVVNVEEGSPQERDMTTGRHTVQDISCNICHTKVGWKYLKAEAESEHYKINKFILERMLIKEMQT